MSEELPLRFQLKFAALELAQAGFFVLDVKRDKETGAPGKKSIQRWSKAEYPSPNIEYLDSGASWATASGIWVRVPDQWVVVDPDSDESEEYWIDRLGPWLHYAAVNKPPNGRPHWWFRISQATASAGVYNWSSLINDNNLRFDVRGQYRGGVMAPPSEHHRGGQRRWVKPPGEAQELPHDVAVLLARHRLPGAPERSGKDLQPLGAPLPALYEDGSGTAYGKAALDKEIKRLRSVWRSDNGQFNNNLNTSAFSVGQLVSGGELAHGYAYDRLLAFLTECQAPRSEFRTLDSGYFDGYDRPRCGPTSSRYFGAVAGEEGDGLLVQTLARDVIKAGPIALGLNGHTWAYDSGVYTMSKDVIRDRVSELLDESFRIRYLASADAVVRSRIPALGGDPVSEFVNFKNGLYAWAEDRLIEHDPRVLSTVQMGTDWDPDATCPEVDRFLAQVLPADIIPLMWELTGYLMYSGNPLQKAVMLTGTGRNGKGTWLRLIRKLLGGAKNITAVTLQAINTERFAAASLYGKIANIAGDIDGTYMSETAKFKAITGEDTITGEFKNRDPFDFAPWAVPVFSANKIPGSADVTVGYMSRWVVIPFPHDFTGREDRNLDERLHQPEEIRGVAARAVRSLRDVMARGNFEDTLSSADAKAQFRRDTDQVATWIAEMCEIRPDVWTPEAEAYKAYQEWANENGNRPLTAQEFHRRVEQEPGVVRKRKSAGVGSKSSIKVHNGLLVVSRESMYKDNYDRKSGSN